jgi:hypothetical protein
MVTSDAQDMLLRIGEIPKPKSQVNPKRSKVRKSQKTRRHSLPFSEFGSLDFAWDLGLGIWSFRLLPASLGFGASRSLHVAWRE